MARPHHDGRADTWRNGDVATGPFAQRMQRRKDAVVTAVQRRLAGRRALIPDAGRGAGAVARQQTPVEKRRLLSDQNFEVLEWDGVETLP